MLVYRDVTSRSGSTAHYLYQTLKSTFEVQHYGNDATVIGSGRKSLLPRIKPLSLGHGLIESAAEDYARAARREHEKDPCDVLIGLFASRFLHEFALPDGLPFVHMSDATPYLREEPRSRYSHEELVELEQKALARAQLCVYPSSWAADSAIKDFGVDPGLVHVIEWGGANEGEPIKCVDQGTVPGSTIELLFIGRDLPRKGIDRLVAALDQLNERGRVVRLTIIGDQLPRQLQRDSIENLGRLSLDDPEQRALFEKAFQRATCLVHPAHMEPYGHVLVESCARGVPVICTRVGGMPSIIKDGVTGLLLSPEPTTGEICEAILRVADDVDLARSLSAGGRRDWEERLCWDRWLERITPLLESL